MNTDYFSKIDHESVSDLKDKDPWDSNQAIPYLLFYKHKEKFNAMFGDKFEVIRKEKLSFILYPASGGFENKAMIPDFMIPVFKGLELVASPLKDLLAFRCFVVLEKK